MGQEEDKVLTSKDTYSVARVLTMRNNIREAIRKTSDKAKYVDLEVPDAVWGASSDDLIDALTPLFAGSLNVNQDVVHQSLHAVLRKEHITVQDVDTAAWILAGNRTKLYAGDPVEPFTHVVMEEWVPVMVLDYREEYRYGNRGGTYSFKVLGGSPCTHTLRDFYSANVAKALRYMFKISYQTKDKLSCVDFVGLRAWLHMCPMKSQERGRPSFTHIACNQPFADYNRKILVGRRTSCIVDPSFTGWKCDECLLGLVSCSQAMHAKNYVQAYCKRCAKQSIFEEGSTVGICLECSRRKRMRKR